MKLDLERLISIPKSRCLLVTKSLDGEDQRRVLFFIHKCDDEIANSTLFLENVKRKEPVIPCAYLGRRKEVPLLVWIEVSSAGISYFSFQNALRHVRVGSGCGRVMLLGPQPVLTRCLHWDFSDLRAGGLVERQQIRSPESAASQGPHALPGSQKGSLATSSLRPNCLVPTDTVVIEPPRGRAPCGLSGIPTKAGGRVSTESAWGEPGMPSCGKPYSLPWKLKIWLCSQAS